MTINIPERLDTLDGVAEKYHALYVKDEGGAFVYKDPKPAIEAMRNAKSERTQLAEKLREYETRFNGVDPDRYRKLIEAEASFKDADAAARGEVERVKSELRGNYEAQLTEKAKREEAWRQKYANRQLDTMIEGALAKAGATAQGAKLLAKTLRQDIQVAWDGDEPTFFIPDPQNGGRPRINAEADVMSVHDLVTEIRREVPHLFGATAGSGGGAGGASGGSVAAPSDQTPSKWSDEQKHAYIKANGHQAYRTLVSKEQEAARAGGKR